MKLIEANEVLGLTEYELVRDDYRARIIAEKKLRRVAVGPKVTVLFENRDTVLLQIQEMLRTERIVRPEAIQHEVDTYNACVPGENELSVTLMVEIADKAERDAFLVAAAGLEKHVWITGAGPRCAVGPIDDRQLVENRTTAVHYLKAALPVETARALSLAARDPRNPGVAAPPALAIEIDHPAYVARAVLPSATVLKLGEDLGG